MRPLILLALVFGLAACGEDKDSAVSPAPATTELAQTTEPAATTETAETPATTAEEPATQPPKPPARAIEAEGFGRVLARPDRQALYYWDVEKRAGGKVKCVDACAEAWPPLYAKGQVPERVPGVSGRFGTIERPDGRLQVTHDGLPIYTYAHEPPGVVLCDDVDDWFVVRLG